MTSIDEKGKVIINEIETFLNQDFFSEGKNYDQFENVVEYFATYLLNPFRIIPYTFFPNFDNIDIDDSSVTDFFVNKVIDKLLPFYSIVRNIDWGDYLADVNVTHTESENNTDNGNSFSVNETSPINANEEINTPNAKGKSNFSNTRNKQINKNSPVYAFEKLKTERIFRDLFSNIQSSIRSIFIEYNSLY